MVTVGMQTMDNFAKLQQSLMQLSKIDVLVGIPKEESTREGSDDINNAELLYIHTHGVRKQEMQNEMQKNIDGGMKYSAAHSLYVQTHGSPLMAIPARPVLEPAIENSKDFIAPHIAKGIKANLDGNYVIAKTELNNAGEIAANASRQWFENPKNGWPDNSESTIKRKGSNRPLIDTNEMRKSITHVVRGYSDD